MKKHPTMAEKEFLCESSAILFSRRRQGSEVKRPFDLYWWVELNFGQEPVFLEASVF